MAISKEYVQFTIPRSPVPNLARQLNVLVNNSLRACLTDFGLSLIRTDETLGYTGDTNSIHGLTARWASPELLREETRATKASDIWGLGCVCYEVRIRHHDLECTTNNLGMVKVLAGKIPFSGQSDLQVLFALGKGTPPARLNLTGPDTTENSIWRLVDRCWSPKPEARPKCKEILENVRKLGLAREAANEDEDHDMRERREFRDAMMGENGEVPIDLNAVETILDAICVSTSS